MATPAAPSINLLKAKRIAFDQQVEAASKGKVYAGIVLVIYVLLLVGVFAADLILTKKNETLENAISKQKLVIASFASKESRMLQVITKAKSIELILSRRKTISDLWQSTQAMLPPQVRLVDFSYEDEHVVIALDVPHVIKAAQLLDVFEQNQQGYAVSESTITLTRSKDAHYRMSVKMALTANKQGDTDGN